MYQIEDIDSLPDVSEFFGLGGTISAGTIVKPEILEIQKALQKLAFFTGDKSLAVETNSRLDAKVAKVINLALKFRATTAPSWMRTGTLTMNAISTNALEIARYLVEARGEKEAAASAEADKRAATERAEEAKDRAAGVPPPAPSSVLGPSSKPCPQGQIRVGKDCKNREQARVDARKTATEARSRLPYVSSYVAPVIRPVKPFLERPSTWVVGGLAFVGLIVGIKAIRE